MLIPRDDDKLMEAVAGMPDGWSLMIRLDVEKGRRNPLIEVTDPDGNVDSVHNIASGTSIEDAVIEAIDSLKRDMKCRDEFREANIRKAMKVLIRTLAPKASKFGFDVNKLSTSGLAFYAVRALTAFMREDECETIVGFTEDEVKNMVLMPRRLTAENGAKELMIGEFEESIRVDCAECDGIEDEFSTECEACGGLGHRLVAVPIKWPTIKDIYARAVAELGKEVG